MDRTKKTGSVRVLIILSILLALSGMAAIASEDDKPITNIFYGNVTLNGADASPGTVINAYIDGRPSGSFEIKDVGMYYISVEGNESDAGGVVTSKVCGATAYQTAVWYASYLSTSLDLSACDNEPPAVTNPDANPSSIVADGVQESRLNVTVIDGCAVGIVTVNLSAIGGSDAQEMDAIGDAVYSTTVSAVEGTKPGTYCLRINASDMHRNWNDSVCIVLEVTAAGLPKTGDINGDGPINMLDAIHLAKYYTGAGSEKFRTIHADGDINSDGHINMLDAIHLAKYYTGAGSEKFRTIYP